jgi:mevalonate pyrophosphate decarboxylase
MKDGKHQCQRPTVNEPKALDSTTGKQLIEKSVKKMTRVMNGQGKSGDLKKVEKMVNKCRKLSKKDKTNKCQLEG